MIDVLNRRGFMLNTAALGAAAAIANAVGGPAAAQTASMPSASFAPKPLPFEPAKIKGFSEKILTSHYENNYGGAVKRLNAITEQLAALEWDKAPGFVVNGLKREELIATNSMILHELFFAGLGEPNQPGAALAAAIAKDFGSMDRWHAEFVAMGKALGGGSGWVLLTYSPRDRRLSNSWAADHTMTLAAGTRILALDMYEHAYQLDFGAKAGDYVAAVMGTLNWSNADKVFEYTSRA
jgi:superoxide dismutase, Fe-Mn family